jgi:hypothetical protein
MPKATNKKRWNSRGRKTSRDAAKQARKMQNICVNLPCPAEPKVIFERVKQAKNKTIGTLRIIGYDGLWGNSLWIPSKRDRDKSRNPYNVYLVFEPTQIKSAIGNDGSWDADDASILSEEAVSLQENSTKMSLDRIHITSVVPEFYVRNRHSVLAPVSIENLNSGIERGIAEEFVPHVLPYAAVMDSTESTLKQFRTAIGLYVPSTERETMATISLNPELQKFPAAERAVFWHEFAHHC